MNCREFVEIVSDYVHHELPDAQCVIIEQHITQCSCCQAYLATFRATIVLCKKSCEELPQKPTAEKLPENLVRSILAKCTHKPSSGPPETSHDPTFPGDGEQIV